MSGNICYWHHSSRSPVYDVVGEIKLSGDDELRYVCTHCLSTFVRVGMMRRAGAYADAACREVINILYIMDK